LTVYIFFNGPTAGGKWTDVRMSPTLPDLGKVVQKDTNEKSSLTAQTLPAVRDTPIAIPSKSLFENNFQGTLH
jgi:hypothetical protein